MLEIKGYITNLGKYNEGELIGEWITFPIDEDELNAVLKRIGCCYYNENGDYINTGYEECFFTDFDGDITDFGEYESISRLNELAEQLEEWDDNTLKAAVEVFGVNWIDFECPDDYILYDNLNNNYDLGYFYAVELDCIDFDSDPILERYFDFDSYGRDIAINSDGGFSSYGWIERTC